jgi:riboflavin kinase/FMN adenylyltransferase
MLLLRNLDTAGSRLRSPILTLGNFDGVHKGHQRILHRLVERARSCGGHSVALTFQPHPAAVLAPDRAPPLITNLRSRVERIAAAEVDAIMIQRFTEKFSRITAEDFVRRLLVDKLHVREIVVGHRVTFGHQRTGGAELLRRLGDECGFDVEVIGPVAVDGIEVSSSAVRRAIIAGDLAGAHNLLGRAVSVNGRVVHGHHRGKTLGFPTANLRVAGLVLPPDGVYAVRVRIGDKRYGGVANLGKRPTFGENERGLESFIFDYDGDLYGQLIDVAFVQQLRGEIKFPNPQALIERIRKDVAAARDVLAASPAP